MEPSCLRFRQGSQGAAARGGGGLLHGSPGAYSGDQLKPKGFIDVSGGKETLKLLWALTMECGEARSCHRSKCELASTSGRQGTPEGSLRTVRFLFNQLHPCRLSVWEKLRPSRGRLGTSWPRLFVP